MTLVYTLYALAAIFALIAMCILVFTIIGKIPEFIWVLLTLAILCIGCLVGATVLQDNICPTTTINYYEGEN